MEAGGGGSLDSLPPILTRLDHIAVLGNALPRRCGLATFTSDIVSGLRERFPKLVVDHYAMDDGSGVAYPPSIIPIRADDPAAYRLAAGIIEGSGAQAIWIQHEFGIFGGDAGGHLLRLIERTTLPIVATLHTVLQRPTAAEREIFEALLQRASSLIVMAENGRQILIRDYGIEPKRIAVIPHGVPDRAQAYPDAAKPRFGLADRKVIMTFGLLAPDKGIDMMIEAMPAVVAAHPDCCYVVIGATHPNLIREQGEDYRRSLMAKVERLGMADRVRFVDAFLDQEELLDWLEACDIYVTPYLNMAQITSGTLSYAIGLGKPVVSTPYLHAAELLADDHGVLVPARDPAALAAAVNMLLEDGGARNALARRAYALGRTLQWPRVVERAFARIEYAVRHGETARTLPAIRTVLPPRLDAVIRMTDATGMFQHAIYSIPDRNHGYCIDDNARALILMCYAVGDEMAQRMSTTYAAFVHHAWNPERGRFRNFMRFDRSWCEDEGSEDSNGRTLWALGTAAALHPDPALRRWASELYRQAIPLTATLGSPRAAAFAALGAVRMLAVEPAHHGSLAILEDTTRMLITLLARSRRPDWAWFEAVLAYDNARLPEALLRAGELQGNAEAIDIGLETLAWIIDRQTGERGAFQPVGTDSFGRAYADPLPFDQQPLEAHATIDACIAAFEITRDGGWADAARKAYGWFTGENKLGEPLASMADGGCHDGLMPHGVNANQGAESILALQLSNFAMQSLGAGVETGRVRDAA